MALTHEVSGTPLRKTGVAPVEMVAAHGPSTDGILMDDLQESKQALSFRSRTGSAEPRSPRP
jgi:hypothetical protein